MQSQNNRTRPRNGSIELTDTGAAALRGPTTVHFNPNLNTDGATTLTTPSGNQFRSHIIGLFYFDRATGKSALIASVKDSVGQLLPPNQIVYKDAFDNITADVLYIYTKGAFEQNIVLLEKPAPPKNYGLSDSSSIEVWTEFIEPPVPQKRQIVLKQELDQQKRQTMVEPDLVDEMLDFGDLIFPVGKAFIWQAPAGDPNTPAIIGLANPDAGDLSVAKQWTQMDQRTILIESLDWLDLEPKLKDLRQAALPLRDGATPKRLAQLGKVGVKQAAGTTKQIIQLAQAPYAPKGVVLDYAMLGSSLTNYVFTNGATYYLSSGSSYASATTTFGNGAVLKFATNTTLVVTGPIVNPTDATNPFIFTSRDDDIFGATLTGISSGKPTFAASQEMVVYYMTSGIMVKNFRFRWAKVALQFEHNTMYTYTLQDTKFEQSKIGIYANYSSVNLTGTNVTQCGVSNAMTGGTSYGYSGAMSFNCGVTNASNLATTAQAEPAIAVNPLNASQIRIVAMHPQATPNPQMVLMTSNNGGATWAQSFLPSGTMPQCAGDSDPALVWDDFGNLILAYRTATGLALYYSTDGGATSWTAVPGFSMTGSVAMPQLATATYGSTNSLWVSVQRDSTVGVVATGTRVNSVGSFSSSWTPQTTNGVSVVPNAHYGQFSSIAIGPAGEVVIAFIERTASSPPFTMHIAIDNDGIGSGTFAEKQTFSVNFGWTAIPASGVDDIVPTPTVGWYRKVGSDRLYITYQDSLSSSNYNTDIYVRYSTDKFTNISVPTKVNDAVGQVNSSASQWMPRLSVDQYSGNVATYWYDCREDGANTLVQLYMAVSQDGFLTGSPRNFRITPTASNLTLPNSYGFRDYIGLTYYNGLIYPAWTGNSTVQPYPEIFSAKIAY